MLFETRSCATPAGHKVTQYLRMASNSCSSYLISRVLGLQACTTIPSFMQCLGSNPGLCVRRKKQMAVRMCSLTSQLRCITGTVVVVHWDDDHMLT